MNGIDKNDYATLLSGVEYTKLNDIAADIFIGAGTTKNQVTK